VELRRQFAAGSDAYGEDEALREMIDERIIIRVAEENEIAVKESELDQAIQNILKSNNISQDQFELMLANQETTLADYREQVRRQMLIQRVTAIEVKRPPVSDDEVAAYYDRHRERFVDPGRVRASHIILLASRERDPEHYEQARAKIAAIKKEIDAGADFAAMAGKYSQDGSARQGGDLDWFERGKMIPAFERAAFAMEVGQIGGPVETAFGFHLIKVTGRETPKQLPFDEVKGEIRRRLEDEGFDKNREEWLQVVRKMAYVEIMY